MDEGLVVEARRQERREAARRRRRGRTRGSASGSGCGRPGPRADRRVVARAFGSKSAACAEPDQRVRLLDAARDDAARPVVLERPPDQRPGRWRAAPRRACRRRSRCKLPAVPAESDRPRRGRSARPPRGEPAAHGQPSQSGRRARIAATSVLGRRADVAPDSCRRPRGSRCSGRRGTTCRSRRRGASARNARRAGSCARTGSRRTSASAEPGPMRVEMRLAAGGELGLLGGDAAAGTGQQQHGIARRTRIWEAYGTSMESTWPLAPVSAHPPCLTMRPGPARGPP